MTGSPGGGDAVSYAVFYLIHLCLNLLYLGKRSETFIAAHNNSDAVQSNTGPHGGRMVSGWARYRSGKSL